MGSVGESQVAADWPPRATLTRSRVEWLTAASVSACPTNVQESQGGRPPPEQNSCVVLDIPIERRTMLPAVLGLPEVSSGWTNAERAAPAAAWSEGGPLVPFS